MIDLHTHSTASDGSDSPARVAELAAGNGCGAFALTDHDGFGGLEEAGRRAAELGLRLVPGCEISCEWDPGTMHLLVYFVGPGCGELEATLGRLQEARARRNEVMIERLAETGLPVTLEEAAAEAGGDVVGRPHVAAVLMAKGVVGSINEAFQRYLAKGRPGYVAKERLAPVVAVELARRCGGVPVIAHPLSLELEPDALEREVAGLAEAGLGGLEAHYGRYSPEERALVADLARRHGLVATGGSDHHGSYKPDLTVGTGRGDLVVPDEVLDELEACRRSH
ncbi:MAG TPA: PHP domain-containing protein [Acidimicrobiales bacterium]|nr:PHP domain-containing protein [Acidimicrobiales bacterium]